MCREARKNRGTAKKENVAKFGEVEMRDEAGFG